MQSTRLTKADSKILSQVFDPESAPEKPEILIDPSLPADRHIEDSDLLTELRQREREAIKLIEAFEKNNHSPSPELHTSKHSIFRSALTQLDALITDHPNYASARNNRAQLRRWYFGDRHLLFCAPTKSPNPKDEQCNSAGTATIADLQESITLATPTRPTDAVAPSQGRVLAQAYTQLGAILHAAGKDLTDLNLNNTTHLQVQAKRLPAPYSTWTQAARFEEEASRLFFLGGLYGNEVAKALAVHANPHAKLCGSIVKEAMKKEISVGESLEV